MRFFHPAKDEPGLIISGSVDRTIRLWQTDPALDTVYRTAGVIEAHASSLNCVGVVHGRGILASGSADATIKIWQVNYAKRQWEICLVQTIQTSPKYLPLTIAFSAMGPSDLLLAVAGTRADIYVYAGSEHDLTHQAVLSGHEGWIRSLAAIEEDNQADGGLLLASASQDKYIRLWRFHRDASLARNDGPPLNNNLDSGGLLSNKAHTVKTSSVSCSITFEALLLGHDDWIYTVSWRRSAEGLRLLSASADSSLAMWAHDEASGVWLCTTRLGEISAQKGSTTATGSMGGFWVGLWSPDGQSVVSLGRTGSWRLWAFDSDRERWMQGIGVSGHTKSVMDIAWARNGSFLLSTGSDQTTRLHAEWTDGGQRPWHEFGRPQIHGYDLNCIDTIGQLQFVSGADEKLLRVFYEPRATAELLQRCCGVRTALEQELGQAAKVPVLGLSNKAVDRNHEISLSKADMANEGGVTPDAALAGLHGSHPPTEDDLARHTLWPESEKLYGHGYEISAVAASHDGSIIATACKASTLDHAVIRLFETKEWRELKPPLRAHSLTVTSLRFSNDDKYLLTTGRDRQWAVFQQDQTNRSIFHLKANNPKAHARMILSACWAPVVSGSIFITAGRDKTCKVWNLQHSNNGPATTITASAPVTAVDILPHIVKGTLVLAAATESGDVTIHAVELAALTVKSSHRLEDPSVIFRFVVELTLTF